MTKLSVNINKIALLRNSRGGNVPDVLKAALDIERFGAEGITVHPRPDERHIRYNDVRKLRPLLKTEFNVEGNPREPSFVKLVLEVLPDQVTLVPDSTNQLTSNHGWDTVANRDYLRKIITVFKSAGIRTSIFVDPSPAMIRGAQQVGADRIELYTEAYAKHYSKNKESAIANYAEAAIIANLVGLGVNAGHDLSLENLHYFADNIPGLLEVSIGHALIADALYLGLENTVAMYKRELVVQKAYVRKAG
ncbi:MAG TPA: pyridoxine 5'-phosphate synthase [Bacteroidia bacterium]|nr:pyridoxine 5'-phosphate synthase [Bacteroidia bacterium]